MVRPLNKEWKLFGQKYHVAGAKCPKVDCKACHAQVSAAINRLQSHIRVCPARSASTAPRTIVNSNEDDRSKKTCLDEIIPQSQDGIIVPNRVAKVTIASSPLAKEQHQSPSAERNVSTVTDTDNSSIHSIGVEKMATVQEVATLSYYKRRKLEIEESRLQLEIKRDEREERRERLEVEILETQARKEKMLAEKEGYESKMLLALSRKKLLDQGVDRSEINRILPIVSSGPTM